jgi:hypothetical protein
VNSQDGYPYKCITINQSGFDKWAQYIGAYRKLLGRAPLSTDHYQYWASAMHMSGSPFTLVCSLHIAAGISEFLAIEHHYPELSWYDGLIDGLPKRCCT